MSSTQFLTIENQIAKKVSLVLTNEHIQQVISFLVAQKIPFEVSFTYNETTTPASLLPEEPPKPVPISTFQHSIIENIYHKYIAKGLTKTPPTQEEIAAELNISVTTFKSRFRDLYGKTFYQVFMDKKMEYAAQLLRRGYRANKVSAMVGYSEKSCIKFNKMFQKHFGITPKKYQIQNQKE